MKTMNRLTIGRARDLIKRELGLSATNITAPPNMNGNRNCPWYEMFSGNQRIEVSTWGDGDFSHGGEMIVLSVTHQNSLTKTSEYFYADSMEYAKENFLR